MLLNFKQMLDKINEGRGKTDEMLFVLKEKMSKVEIDASKVE